MGLKDMWFGLIGKTAEERKKQAQDAQVLKEQLAELKTENATLQKKTETLETKNVALKAAHIKGANNAYKGGVRVGREQMRQELTEEGWQLQDNFKDLPQQKQMAKYLAHIVNDDILPQDQEKVLKTLSELMQSDSVDIMRGEKIDSRHCLMDEFLQGFYEKDIHKKDQDFYRKAFKIILNTKGKNGPKVDLTSYLPHGKNPLIGYFGALKALRPFLDTALESAAFDMDKFDYKHFRGVFGHGDGGSYTWEWPNMRKTLLLHGFDAYGAGFGKEFYDESKELFSEGKLKEKPEKKSISKAIQRIHQMSVREMQKALEEKAKAGEVIVLEDKKTPKTRLIKPVKKSGRG